MTTKSPTQSSCCLQTTVSATYCEMAYTDFLETVDEKILLCHQKRHVVINQGKVCGKSKVLYFLPIFAHCSDLASNERQLCRGDW